MSDLTAEKERTGACLKIYFRKMSIILIALNFSQIRKAQQTALTEYGKICCKVKCTSCGYNFSNYVLLSPVNFQTLHKSVLVYFCLMQDIVISVQNLLGII